MLMHDIHKQSYQMAKNEIIKCQKIWRWHFTIYNVNDTTDEVNNDSVKLLNAVTSVKWVSILIQLRSNSSNI